MVMKSIKSVLQCLSAGVIALSLLSGCSKKAEVPGVVGLTVEAATAKLTAAGLVVSNVTAETGGPESTPATILRQEPAAGQRLAKGSAVQLVVDNTVTVPDLVGLEMNQAFQAVARVNLTLATETGAARKGAAPNSVVEQNPPSGSRISSNTPVRVIIAG